MGSSGAISHHNHHHHHQHAAGAAAAAAEAIHGGGIAGTNGYHQRTQAATWTICGHQFSRECVVYAFRGIMLYIVLIASVINLALNIPPRELWITSFALSTGGMGLSYMGSVLTQHSTKFGSVPSVNST